MSALLPDTNVLIELAKNNPEELERIRVQQINKLIEDAPEYLKPRLRGLQFQIDCKRRLHKSPLGSCIEISKMMMGSLNSLSETLQGRAIISGGVASHRNASVFEFPNRRSHQRFNKEMAP